ncbi:MAG: hypothetical protein ACJ8FY_23265 [Gemmataceae bacterium]
MTPEIKFYGVEDVYSDTGIDLTLLRRNLQFSPTQRLERGLSALEFAKALQQAGSKINTRQSQPIARGADMSLNLEMIIRQLHIHKVDYVLIGGQAMTVQGSAHITFDLAICYARTPQNIAALATALAPYHAYMRGSPVGLPFQFDSKTIEAGLNFTLQTDLGEVDVLGEVSGLGRFDKVLAKSEPKDLFGVSVQVLTIDGLLAAKKAAGRVKDRNHILELEEMKKIHDAGQ